MPLPNWKYWLKQGIVKKVSEVFKTGADIAPVGPSAFVLVALASSAACCPWRTLETSSDTESG